MVGHLLEYHPGVVKLKQLIDDGELGRVLYIYGNRLNLGKLRADENALWSLGAHDVSVLLRLAGEEPYEVEARGESYMREGVEDVVFCFLRFPSGLAAHLHLSWLDPHKERRFTVVGEQPHGDLRRHGARGQDHRLRQGLRRADELVRRVHHPLGRHLEPAALERRAAADRDRALRATRSATGTAPISDGVAGLRVVRVLEALQQSLDATRRDGLARTRRAAHRAVQSAFGPLFDTRRRWRRCARSSTPGWRR